ncbi:LOW QUALITY PROTEIN: hypothetical protein BRADI_2g47501v3 [Brachypodium distachyon]|uniref:Uncharacterized protein n=1 Tax=Brachypodium distachyon TaxID=15368 RepID=A0A2K2DEF5_BRADI|nr:LOW QUALITY PROTEIN: hypothetical protein BRADI_2g47501v3 [Brachypodium distachyon]
MGPPRSMDRSKPSSSESQSGKAEAAHANAPILSAAAVVDTSSASSSLSESQSASCSVLLGDLTNPCFFAASGSALEQSRAATEPSKKSFASAESHPGTSGTSAVYPIRWTAAKRSLMSLQGARPVAISTTVQPSAHTSDAVPCSSPRATSGAMNAGVPPIGSKESTGLAQPKSVSLARPSPPITTFLALTSPCTSDLAWRYSSPRATSPARMAGSGRRPPALLAASSASEPPGANSRKSWYSPHSSAARDPRQGTMCGEQSPVRTHPSRSSSRAAPPAAAADLTARSSPEASSEASHTTAPDAPRPSVRTRLSCFTTVTSIV